MDLHTAHHKTPRIARANICSVCDKSFRFLKVHLQTHSGAKPFSCSDCDMTFSHSQGLKYHQYFHSGEIFSCSKCDKYFTNPNHLKRHLKAHSGKKPFSCSFCVMNFFRPEHLKKHQRIHTGEKPYGCSECDESFTSSSNQKAHIKSVHEMIRYVCDHCEHTASSTSHLRGHINKKHPGKDLPTVFTEIKADQILSEQFTTKSKLIKSCHVCLKEFTSVRSKTDHGESVHEMIRYLCDHCEHIASSKRSLRGHINKKHPGKSLPTVYTKIKADQIQKSNSTNTPEVVEHKLQPQNKTSWFAEMEGEMGASITMGPELAESKPAQHDKTALVAKSKENIDAMIERRDSVWTCTN